MLPRDRLGLFFNTTIPPVYFEYDVNFNYRVVLKEMPAVNDTFMFESTLTVNFVAAGFVNTSTYGLTTVL